ncbi:unnamed protein product [Pylaiella littoralis]
MYRCSIHVSDPPNRYSIAVVRRHLNCSHHFRFPVRAPPSPSATPTTAVLLRIKTVMLNAMSRNRWLCAVTAVAEARAVLAKHFTPMVPPVLKRRPQQRFDFSSSSGGTREDVIASILESKVEASKAVVHDISGGCGSMFKIEVESPLFRGKGLVAQHRIVKDALKAEIADMHGLTLLTRPTPA